MTGAATGLCIAATLTPTPLSGTVPLWLTFPLAIPLPGRTTPLCKPMEGGDGCSWLMRSSERGQSEGLYSACAPLCCRHCSLTLASPEHSGWLQHWQKNAPAFGLWMRIGEERREENRNLSLPPFSLSLSIPLSSSLSSHSQVDTLVMV